ncbi:MAG: hypothetical protein CMK33_02130 [Porticoccaceae bacterium]|nr:hypothetical protein [Porticoccaceae bacterium]
MAEREQVDGIAGPAGTIEVCRRAPARTDRDCVAVIAHPHPLHGGSMDNKVVTTLARMYSRLGATAVRFNFRGVGGSAGVHDQGRGEVEDLLAVARWALDCQPGAGLLLAGYSFGSAVAAAAAERVPARQLALIAPPVDRYSYAPKGDFPCATVIVLGGADELVDAGMVTSWAADRAAVGQLILLPGASHFFHGQLVTLEQELAPVVAAALA